MVLPYSSLRRAPRRPAVLAGTVAATLALLGAALPAIAQPAVPQPASAPSRADPLDARAAVPPVRFSSAFAPYRRMSDAPVGSWREANDTVTQIGGWRAYAREANTPPAPAANPAPGASPKPALPSAGGAQGEGQSQGQGHGHGHHAPK